MVDLTQFKAKQRVLGSYREAQSVVEFPVKTPAFLPSNLSLSRIIYVLPPWLPNDYRGAAGFLDFVYSGGQATLVISQGYINPFDARGAPPGKSGDTAVNGRPASWMDGFLTVDEPVVEERPENNPTARWQPGRLTLGWHGDDLASYRLTSTGLSLDDLVRTAESLR